MHNTSALTLTLMRDKRLLSDPWDTSQLRKALLFQVQTFTAMEAGAHFWANHPTEHGVFAVPGGLASPF